MVTPQGYLRVFTRDKVTKQQRCVRQASNLVVYQSGDILAKIAGGDSSFFPSHIYGEHAPHPGHYTEGVPSGLTEALTDNITVLRTSPRITTNAEESILGKSFAATTEFPVGTPVSYWQHNQVTYVAVVSDSAVDGDIFVGAGLVTQANGQEYLFAHQYYNGLVKLASFDIVYIWTVRYT